MADDRNLWRLEGKEGFNLTYTDCLERAGCLLAHNDLDWPKPGNGAFKYGRTTGFTKGKINEVDAVIPDADRFLAMSVAVGDKEDLFVARGDSGSGAFDKDGKPCGIVWGKSSAALTGNLGFVLPLRSILKDIKESLKMLLEEEVVAEVYG